MQEPVPPHALSCEEVRDELHSLVMNELEDHEAQPILEHLAGCAECRGVLGQHAQLTGLLSEHMPNINRQAFRPYYRYN